MRPSQAWRFLLGKRISCRSECDRIMLLLGVIQEPDNREIKWAAEAAADAFLKPYGPE